MFKGKYVFGLLVVCALPLMAQVKVQQPTEPAKANEGGIPGKVTSVRVRKVEAVIDPTTVVNFETARLTDIKGKAVKINLKDKVTVIEYWSRNANRSNLYWNRMRELEHKHAGSEDLQIISINYDNALGGEGQRQAVVEFLKKNTPPQTLYLDVDDAVREMFSIPGAIGYMLFNHNEQYIFCGRGDDPTAEELFSKIDEAVKAKQKWDEYVKKTLNSVVEAKK